MKKIIILLMIIFILTGCGSKIKTYDTKMVCKLDLSDEIDGDLVESKSIVYVDYDSKNNVTKAIYQSISNAAYYDNSLIESLDYVIKLYNDMDGISARRYKVDDELVFEITYEYEKINLDEFREELGDLIDDVSILGSATSLPVKLSDFENVELSDYKCEVK